MKKTFNALLLGSFIAGLALLTSCQDKSQLHKNSVFTFGTLVDISLYHDEPAKVEEALKIIQQDFDYLNFAFHAWQPGPLGRINQLLETQGTFTANPSVLPLIKEAQRLSLLSQGLFNPALGHLIKLWGFHDDSGVGRDSPPEATAIQALLEQQPSMQNVHINNTQVKSENAAIKLDMGAIAKGYALDRVIEHLQDSAIEHVIINAGGDLKAIGRHPAGRPWHIGIRHPRQAETVLAGLDVVSGESVFTSGDYERFFMHEGKRYHHILDPRTGYPAMQAQSVTVIHTSATLADAASTALFIAGPELWPEIAKQMGITLVLFIDAQGKVEVTPAMRQRLQQIAPATEIKIRDLP